MKIVGIALFVSTLIFSIHAQTFVESDPFLKWKSTANGLSYSTIEIEPTSGTLLSNRLSSTDEYTLIINDPKGFHEVNGNVFFGIELTIIDVDADTLIFKSNDLYSEIEEGFSADLLNNLNVDFTPSFTAKNILLKARFFDKKGKGEVLVEWPFTLANDADVRLNTEGFYSWTDKPTIMLIGQSVDVDGNSLKINNSPLSNLEFTSKDVLSFHTNLSKFKSDTYNINYTLLDTIGTQVFKKQKTLPANWDGKIIIEMPKGLSPQPYLLTFSIETIKGKFGFSQWFHFKDKTELTDLQKEKFGELFAQIALKELTAENERGAEMIILNAIFYAPNQLQTSLALGKIYLENDKIEDAIATFVKATDLYKNNLELLQTLASTYQLAEQNDKAIEIYKNCIELDPNNFMNYFEIGWIYNDIVSYEEAIPYLTKAIDLNTDPSNYKLYEERITSNKGLKNYTAVLNDYQKLVEIDPTDWRYYYEMGYIFIDTGNYERAIEQLSKAISMNETATDALYERGYANEKAKKYTQAIDDYNKTIELEAGGEPDRIYLHLGDCYFELGQKEKACTNYQKALDRNVSEATIRILEKCGK